MSIANQGRAERPEQVDWPRLRTVLGAIISVGTVTAPMYVAFRVLALANWDVDAGVMIITYSDPARLALAALVYWGPVFGLIALAALPSYAHEPVRAYRWLAFLVQSGLATAYATGAIPSSLRWWVAGFYAFSAFALAMAVEDIHRAMIREKKTFWRLAADTFTPKLLRPRPDEGHQTKALKIVNAVVALLFTLLLSMMALSLVARLSFSDPPTKWIAFDESTPPQAVSWTAAGDGGTYFLLREPSLGSAPLQWHEGLPAVVVVCDTPPLLDESSYQCGK